MYTRQTKNTFFSVCFSLLIICLITISSSQAGEPIYLKIAASSMGGSWFPTMAATSFIINKNVPDVSSAVTTGGAVVNAQSVEQGKIDMGFTYTDTVADAWDGKGAFKTPHRKIRAIGVYFQDTFSIAVRADGDIRSFKDLTGKSITAGKPGFGSTAAFERILKEYGLSFEKIRETGGKVNFVGWSEGVLLMQDRHVVAMLTAQAIPAPLIQEVETSYPLRVLGVEPKILDELISKYPGYVKLLIKAGTYKGHREDVWVLGSSNLLICKESLPEDLVYQITKAIYENVSEIALSASWLKNMSYKTAMEGVVIPFHLGAAKYFREKGLQIK
jgi:TRAP transporter TAXI family solute receptor